MNESAPFSIQISPQVPADELEERLRLINWHNQQIDKLLRGELDPEEFMDACATIEGLDIEDYFDTVLQNLDYLSFQYHASQPQ